MNKKKILRIILVILIVLWMVIVFRFSHAQGSSSSGISQEIAEFLFKGKEYIDFAEAIIRKLAHLSEYALGGMLVYSLFLTFDIKTKLQFIDAFSFTSLYAISDEIHQLFVPGRSGRIIDVFIDMQGALLGMCAILLFVKIVQFIRNIDKSK